MSNKGKLVVLSAPSGAGKTSICKELLKRNKNWLFSVSVTTREKRDNEVDGVDYIFISKEKFEHLDKFGELIESEWVHGNRYGTQIVPLEEALDNDKIMLIDVDVKGAMNLIEDFEDDVISIFIEPPGMNDADKKESLSDRLQKRGNTNDTLIKQRLKRFDLELSYKEKFNFSYVNEKLEDATNKVEKFIKENI
jgi:guanylate kinase|tara:strand:+ start:173 stop:754 length:582 start_codon:yes stop_codon:yes gene_type:complete